MSGEFIGYAIKAAESFFVAGQMVTPGKIAEVSAHEALDLFRRDAAVPAEAADVSAAYVPDPEDPEAPGTYVYPVSGTIDSETIQTCVAHPDGEGMLARSKSFAALLGEAA